MGFKSHTGDGLKASHIDSCNNTQSASASASANANANAPLIVGIISEKSGQCNPFTNI